MLSVLIPLYNKRDSIKTTIESVLHQTFTDFEVIVVDDGSTDGSGEIVKSINDNRIYYVRKENGGVSSARNYGLKLVKSELVALLDGDDLWDSEYLEQMMALIGETPDAVLWGSGYRIQQTEEREAKVQVFSLPSNYRGYVNNYFDVACHNTLFTSSSVVLRKSVILKNGGYDESLIRGEDVDLWFRLALNGRVAFLNKPMVTYCWYASNRAMNKKVDKSKCLIWNLDRYKEYEESNEQFKHMLDCWRLAHIVNYLTGWSTEVFEITPLLKQMDLSKFGKRWRILKYTPHFLQRKMYSTIKCFQ